MSPFGPRDLFRLSTLFECGYVYKLSTVHNELICIYMIISWPSCVSMGVTSNDLTLHAYYKYKQYKFNNHQFAEFGFMVHFCLYDWEGAWHHGCSGAR